jgi:Leucine-rich repeat (LRR) protein
MTERLGTLSNLDYLLLSSCSLTHLPNLSGIRGLWNVNLNQNRLSKVDGLTGVVSLFLIDNLFTDIPKLVTPNTLKYLYMSNNPVRNMLAITSHVNLSRVFLRNATLSSIPATIDRLQQLEDLVLSYNKLFYLPTNMRNLVKLQYFDIQNNLFSPADIQAFKTQLNMSHPNMTLLS